MLFFLIIAPAFTVPRSMPAIDKLYPEPDGLTSPTRMSFPSIIAELPEAVAEEYVTYIPPRPKLFDEVDEPNTLFLIISPVFGYDVEAPLAYIPHIVLVIKLFSNMLFRLLYAPVVRLVVE
jgi:hypothetical protein